MPVSLITNSHLYGLLSEEQEQALVWVNAEHCLQADCAAAFFKLQEAAKSDGIQLECASGFRSFTKQKSIWERKFHHDPRYRELPVKERIEGILKWSALPGTSRHHWGTDLDVFDAQSVQRTNLKLEAWEYEAQGPCALLFQWLNRHAADFGFFQPYDRDRGGVGVEPWHWSYMPIAAKYLQAYRSDALLVLLEHEQLSGLNALKGTIDNLVERYVFNINPALLGSFEMKS